MSMIIKSKECRIATSKTELTKPKNSSIIVRSSMPRIGQSGRTRRHLGGLFYGVVRVSR